MVVKKYKPITQRPYCCVPACIFMVLDRRGIKHGSQEEIGWDLGLVVPENIVRFFKKVRTGKKPIAGYGTRVSKKIYSINNYFLKNKINLKESFHQLRDIKDVKKFISENLENNNDIAVCFNDKRLFGRGDWGHVCLIESLSRDIVSLIDPDRRFRHRRKVSLAKLIEAIRYHEKTKRAGFWVISDNE